MTGEKIYSDEHYRVGFEVGYKEGHAKGYEHCMQGDKSLSEKYRLIDSAIHSVDDFVVVGVYDEEQDTIDANIFSSLKVKEGSMTIRWLEVVNCGREQG